MNKPKHGESSQAEKWLAGSRSFDLYTTVSIPEIIEQLEFFQPENHRDRHYTVAIEKTSAGINLRVVMFQHTTLGVFRSAWMEAQAEPVENMERTHIQGKIFTRLRYSVIGVAIWTGFLLSLIALFFPDHNWASFIVGAAALGISLFFISVWANISGAQNELLHDFGFVVRQAILDQERAKIKNAGNTNNGAL